MYPQREREREREDSQRERAWGGVIKATSISHPDMCVGGERGGERDTHRGREREREREREKQREREMIYGERELGGG